MGGFHAADHGAGVFESHVEPGHFPGRLGKRRGDDLHAARGAANDDVIAEGLHDLAQGEYFAAALTGAVPGGEGLFLGEPLYVEPFEILECFCCDSHSSYSLTLMIS